MPRVMQFLSSSLRKRLASFASHPRGLCVPFIFLFQPTVFTSLTSCAPPTLDSFYFSGSWPSSPFSCFFPSAHPSCYHSSRFAGLYGYPQMRLRLMGATTMLTLAVHLGQKFLVRLFFPRNIFLLRKSMSLFFRRSIWFLLCTDFAQPQSRRSICMVCVCVRV